MRVMKVLGPAVLMLIGLCLMVGATQASAAATGVCDETPSAETHECHPTTEFLEGEKFKAKSVGKVIIKDRFNNRIECEKSKFLVKLGANPSLGAVSTKIAEEFTWEECKLGNGESCGTSKSPYPGEVGFPWPSPLQWTEFGTTGPNGTQKIEKVTAQFKCGTKECKYVGAGVESSITGKFYNADDTNKPAATGRAVLGFKEAAMNASINCTMQVELLANYELIPPEVNDNIFIGNG